MADLLGLWPVPAALALVPALFRLYRGRTMAGHAADPALPERLAGSRNTLVFVFSSVMAALIVVWPQHLWWSIPLLLLSFLAAGWPLRRVLFGETWGLGTYLWFYTRMFVAIYGFWLLLIAAPWITRGAGAGMWIASAVLAAVLIAWNEQNGHVIRFLLRARPVETPDLLERFTAIVSAARVPSPRIEYVDMRGGVLVNAIALPDTEQPGVLFTSSLLERLDAREIAGVFAHEVAHLEHFNRAFLKKLRWVGWAMVAAAVTVGPLVRTQHPGAAWLLWGWPIVVIAYTAILTGSRQKHETESDLRAVALTGDAEALIHGLVKLHTLAKMPRRLDPNIEATASHPSLARRVQAIREAGRIQPAALDEPLTLTSGTASVTLPATRLEWREGDDSSYTLAYSSLSDLRVEADARGAMRITASDPKGRQWSMPLDAADVARAQAALDVIDARVRPSATGQPTIWRTIGALVALLCVVSAAGLGLFAVMAVTVLAVFVFEKPVIRVAGVAGLVGASIALRDQLSVQYALVLILSAGLLLFIGSRDRLELFSRRAWWAVNGVGALAVVMIVPLALLSVNVLTFHQSARQWSAAAVFALAFAAANAMRDRRRQVLTIVAVIAGVVLVAAGDTRLLDAALRDPFLSRGAAPESAAVRGTPLMQFEMAFHPSTILLSPGAGAMAAGEGEEYDGGRYHVGRPGQALHPVPADDAVFVDDQRLLVISTNPPDYEVTTLSLIDVDGPATPIWQQQLAVSGGVIAIDRGGSRWRVLGRGGPGQILAVEGAMDGGESRTRSWPTGAAAAVSPLGVSGSRLLIADTSVGSSRPLQFEWYLMPFMSRMRSETRFATVDAESRSPLFTSTLYAICRPSRYMDEGPLCSAHDGSRTHVGRMNSADGTVTPLVMFDGFANIAVSRRWLTGWAREPFALDLETQVLVKVDYQLRRDRLMPLAIAGADDALAVVTTNGSGDATVMFYRAPAGGSDTR